MLVLLFKIFLFQACPYNKYCINKENSLRTMYGSIISLILLFLFNYRTHTMEAQAVVTEITFLSLTFYMANRLVRPPGGIGHKMLRKKLSVTTFFYSVFQSGDRKVIATRALISWPMYRTLTLRHTQCKRHIILAVSKKTKENGNWPVYV